MRSHFIIVALLAVPAVVSAQERLTLQAALAEALDKSLELLAKRAGVSVADANQLTAGLRPNPLLSVGRDHLDLLGTGFNEENGAGPPEYSARVDFLIERGDKRARRIDVAQDERAIAEAELRDAIRSLTTDVRQAFIDLQLAQENLTLARDNAAAFDEIVALNQARVRSGDLAEVELLRSRVAALQSQQAVRAAELKVRSERRRLERTIGRTPGVDAFEIEALDRPTRITESLSELQAHARRAHPISARSSSRRRARRRRSGDSSQWAGSTGRSASRFGGRTAWPVAAIRWVCL